MIIHRIKGFSLIELMIVVTIIGLLLAFAYPMYTQQIVKSRRAEGKAALLDLNNRMARYFSVNNTYATATIAANSATTDVLSNATSDNGWYKLSITTKTATTFTIAAAPQNTQATEDALCATFTMNHLGNKSVSGTGTIQQCW